MLKKVITEWDYIIRSYGKFVQTNNKTQTNSINRQITESGLTA